MNNSTQQELLGACRSALRALQDNLEPGPMDEDAINGLKAAIKAAEQDNSAAAMIHKGLGGLARLIGGTVTRLIRTKEQPDMGEIFGLEVKVRQPDRTFRTYNVWFLSDFEGNGPGGFEIDEE